MHITGKTIGENQIFIFINQFHVLNGNQMTILNIILMGVKSIINVIKLMDGKNVNFIQSIIKLRHVPPKIHLKVVKKPKQVVLIIITNKIRGKLLFFK